ncbi:hypothetical protein MANES_02G202000v8 [Manihot esculenta]|uniref:Uncharacterized protein n=1 Tax=Manihot esculenta TaxID=3983 RepID=A0ACB7I7R6_MANES|nr:hypothetical protein MANES_02G202000v8 [Manihot esculenta]
MASMGIQIASASASFSSPSSTRQWKYDVFLSFRGEDTRTSFTDHLYAALNQKGIVAFRDDRSLQRGKEIAPELLKAIEDSRLSIVVLSRNYASSTWCLDELVKILDCMNTKGQIIFPIFYNVDPSDVRKQKGYFEKAFAKHDEDFGQNAEKVNKWRTTLTKVANLSGWDSHNRHETELIQDIVEAILARLNHAVSAPTIGIRVLIDKSLLTIIGKNTLWMHDLLQEMGQKIVWKESPDEPGKRSRLSFDKDVYHVLTENSGTEAVEMMSANFLGRKNINLSAKALSNMRKLRLLKIENVQLSQGLEFLSNEIRLLEWHGYPLKSLPSCFKPEKLVELRMPCSCIKQLWSGIITLDGLKYINLRNSQALRRTPDFTRAPHLEKLVLEGCTSLIEVHPSIFLLKWLMILNMKDCIGLQTLPISIEMPSLQVLILSGCFKLKKFPEIKGNMEHLLELHLEGTAIVELPLSIEHLSGLVLLNLRNCKRLISLPSNIFHYISLKTLILSGCSKFDKFPGKLGNEECLEELDISGTAVRQLPSSIVLLKNLRRLTWQGCEVQPSEPWSSLLNYFSSWQSLTSLNLSNCNFPVVVVPSDIGCLSSLKVLDLSFNKFASLPASISQLSSLTVLRLVDCKWLQSLPELPANVKRVFAGGCIALENIPNPLKPCTPRDLQLNLFNCHRLVDHHNLSRWACKLLKTHLKGLSSEASFRFEVCIPGSEIPEWFKNQNMGSSVSLDLPPHRNNDNLMGIAICANFILRPSASSNYGYKKKTRLGYFILGCGIKNDQGKDALIDPSLYSATLEENSAQIGLDHLWLVGARSSKTASLDGHDPNGRSLSFWALTAFSNLEVEYRKCGFRYAYSQDLEE